MASSRLTYLVFALLASGLLTMTPGSGARGETLPDGATVLHESLATMGASLHTVHGVSQTRGQEGTHQMSLRTVGGCVMRDAVLRSRFHMWGTRFVIGAPGKVRSERYNRRFVFIIESGQSSKVWERNLLTDNRWRRSDSNDDALAGLALCPASTLLTRSWEQMAGWTNLGAVTVAGHDTWHLHAEQVQSQDNQTAGNQVDLYVDQTSHFLIRSRTEQTMAGSSPSSYVTTTTFSRFNVPLAIKPPS